MSNLFRKSKAPKHAGMPIMGASYVAVDTELTGLDDRKDSIVSIGAVRVSQGRVLIGETFHSLVRPETELTRGSVIIHGITPSDVAGRPDTGAVLKDFLEFCGDDVLVGHCIDIDLEFMSPAVRRSLGVNITNPLADTHCIHMWLRGRVQSYRELSPSLSQLGLYAIAKSLGIRMTGAHDALNDAFLTALVFQRFLHILDRAGVRDVGRLVKIADPYKCDRGSSAHSEIRNL